MTIPWWGDLLMLAVFFGTAALVHWIDAKDLLGAQFPEVREHERMVAALAEKRGKR